MLDPVGMGTVSRRRPTPELCRILDAAVVDRDGGWRAFARVTLHVAQGSAWDTDEPAFHRTSWGAVGDELRLHLVLGGPHEGGQVHPFFPWWSPGPPSRA